MLKISEKAKNFITKAMGKQKVELAAGGLTLE